MDGALRGAEVVITTQLQPPTITHSIQSILWPSYGWLLHHLLTPPKGDAGTTEVELEL
jgi:hypothetical protein